MAEWTAEKFAERVHDVGLLEKAAIEGIWSEIGSLGIPLDEFISLMLRKQLLTNLQVARVLKGERYGYFYGKYKLLYLVGVGTFARVYRGVHVNGGEIVAVKVLRSRYVDDLNVVDQFLREANLMMPLRHVNIVPVHEVSTERNRPYMVMEFVEGGNLRDLLKVRRRFELAEALRILCDVASGLDYALGQGLTHRDLKLSNVLVASVGRAKLVDFGLAAISAAAKDDPTGKTPNPRSIDYAGLERITHVRRDDPRSDIYFAGCMLYHVLTGVSPLLETKDRTQRLSVSRYRDVKPITQHEPNLPNFVVSLVTKAMELDPERRFASPAELLAELRLAKKRLEGGDDEPAVSAEPAGDRASVGRAPLEREGQSHTVMIVESDVDMQDALRDLLKRRGYRVLVIGDAQRAVARFQGMERPAECVIFCTTELGESALEAFNQFGEGEYTRNIPAVLFADERHKELAGRAVTAAHRVLLFMPLKVRQFRAVLRKLLARAPGGTE